MKKPIAIACALALALMLAGCGANADSVVSRMVEPEQYGSVLSDTPPSALLDPADSGKNQPLYDLATSTTAFTVNMRYMLRHGYFVGEEFSFYVPPQWRTHFDVRAAETRSGTFYLRTFDFCYTDDVSGAAPILLRIDVVYAEFADAYGNIGREELGRSSDGVYVYLKTPVGADLPENFGAVGEYLEITRLLQGNTLDFKVLS